MENTLVVFFDKIIVYMPGKIWDRQNLAIFWPKLTVWRFLAFNFQTPLWIFLIFGMKVALVVVFEKIILYMLEKFWYGKFLPFKTKLLPFLAKIDSFESFWSPVERLGPINSRLCVRISVRLCVRPVKISKTVHRMVLNFGTMLQLDNGKKVTFLFLVPRGTY